MVIPQYTYTETDDITIKVHRNIMSQLLITYTPSQL